MHWYSPAMSSPSSSAGSRAGRFLSLAVAAAGYLTFLNMWCVQALLPLLVAGFHITPAQASLSVTAPLVATAIMAPVVGAVSDRFGRKRFIVGAATLLIIPTVLSALAPNITFLAACRFVQGLTLPFIFTVTIAYIGDEMSGTSATRLAGTYTSGTILGGFSGRFIAGLVAQGFGWRPAFLAIAVLTLTLAMVVAALLPRERQFRPVTDWHAALAAFPAHLTNARLLGTYAVGFGVLFSLTAIFTFINFRLAAAPYHLGPAALGGIFVVYLGGAAITPVAGRLAAKYGRRTIMLAAVMAIWAGLALTLLGPFWMIELGLLVSSMGIFVEQTLATGFVGQAARMAKSTAVGLYVTAYYVGGSFGGVVPAGPWHSYGWPGCVAIVAVLQAAMLGVAAATWRPRDNLGA